VRREPRLVSAVIPVHNRAGALAEAVASALAQEHRPIEVIVVDDGSTDDTGAEAERLAREHPAIVHALHRQNGGPGAARETGRGAARGEYVQYLDSDDLLLAGKWGRQVAALEADPEADIAYCVTIERKLDPAIQPPRASESAIEAILPRFLVGRYWRTVSPLYRTRLLDRAGPWLPLWMEEDWEYDCRLGALGARLAFVPEILGEMRDVGGARLSRRQRRSDARLADRAIAHTRVLEHARTAGVAPAAPEMRTFARQLFLLARQCGAAGLAVESARLLELARGASTPERSRGLDFRLYGLAARVAGPRLAGRLAGLFERYGK
jgi:cellulose synthase/poly-beta-1,6-N-acetylglucosamine synthase-like glycosyltransferase